MGPTRLSDSLIFAIAPLSDVQSHNEPIYRTKVLKNRRESSPDNSSGTTAPPLSSEQLFLLRSPLFIPADKNFTKYDTQLSKIHQSSVLDKKKVERFMRFIFDTHRLSCNLNETHRRRSVYSAISSPPLWSKKKTAKNGKNPSKKQPFVYTETKTVKEAKQNNPPWKSCVLVSWRAMKLEKGDVGVSYRDLRNTNTRTNKFQEKSRTSDEDRSCHKGIPESRTEALVNRDEMKTEKFSQN